MRRRKSKTINIDFIFFNAIKIGVPIYQKKSCKLVKAVSNKDKNTLIKSIIKTN